MTVEQIVFACMVHENCWVDIAGKPVTSEGRPDVYPSSYPLFSYYPRDDNPWGICHGNDFALLESTDVERFKKGVQTYLNLIEAGRRLAGVLVTPEVSQ